MSLKNIGNSLAAGISAVLETNDPYITIIENTQSFGDIAPGDTAINNISFVFSISSQAPPDHRIVFSVKPTDIHGGAWDNHILLKVTTPEIAFDSYSVVETTGDGDQIPDVGETCNLLIQLGNYGARSAKGINATLITYNPDIAIIDKQASINEILENSTGVSSDDPFTVQIKDSALSHLVKFYLDVQEGAGYYKTRLEFNLLLEQGRVLLVIDDGPSRRSSYYAEILDEYGVPTDQWWVVDQGAVPQNKLLQYKDVIWFTGAEPINTLTDEDQANLGAFLDNGGHLLISGQMLGLNIKDSTFYSNYLHAKFINLRTGLHHLKAVAGNGVTSLDTISVAGVSENFQSFTNEIDPIAPGFAVYAYDITTAAGPGNIQSSGTAMIAFENGTYKTVLCGFGFEGITPYESRKTMLSDVLTFFKGSPLDTRAILTADNYSFDDDSLGSSQGDGDGFINPGEKIELRVELKNNGNLLAKDVTASVRSTSPYITIIDSVKMYGNIRSGSAANTSSAFSFSVDESAPHNTPILFELVIVDSTTNHGFLIFEQDFSDVAPDNGLFHIPLSMQPGLLKARFMES